MKVTEQAGRSEKDEVIKGNQPRSSKESGMTEVLTLIQLIF